MEDKRPPIACGFFLKTGIIVSAKQSYKKNKSWVDITDFYGGRLGGSAQWIEIRVLTMSINDIIAVYCRFSNEFE